MALLEESRSQPTEDTGMQSVLRTLLKKKKTTQNKNRTHSHSNFKFPQEQRNFLNEIHQETVLLKTYIDIYTFFEWIDI